MRNENQTAAEPRIYTTHNRHGSRPKMIAKPAVVNGVKALVFEKDGQIDHYIPYEEVNRVMYASNLPERELDF